MGRRNILGAACIAAALFCAQAACPAAAARAGARAPKPARAAQTRVASLSIEITSHGETQVGFVIMPDMDDGDYGLTSAGAAEFERLASYAHSPQAIAALEQAFGAKMAPYRASLFGFGGEVVPDEHRCVGGETAEGFLRERRFDPAPLLPLLRRQGIGQLTVTVTALDFPARKTAAPAQYLPAGSSALTPSEARLIESEGYSMFSIPTDRPPAGDVRIWYGYSVSDLRVPFILFGLIFFLPLALTLWMRSRALRAAQGAAGDAEAAWFGYSKFLGTMSTVQSITWVAAMLVFHAWNVVAFYTPDYGEAKNLAPIAFCYLPALMTILCYALSQPVYARVRGLDCSFGALLRQAAWGQARLIPIFCYYAAINNIDQGLQIAGVWWVAGMVLQSAIPNMAARSLGTSIHAVTSGDVRDKISEMAARAKVNVAHVFLMPTANMRVGNAFASSNNSVVVTDYLLDHLTRREVDTVMAHEITHLRHRHPQALANLQRTTWVVVIGAIVLSQTAGVPYLRLLMMLTPWGLRAADYEPYLLAGLYLALSVAALLVISVSSRGYERVADDGAVQLTGDPEAYLRAQIKLSRLNLHPLEWGKRQEAWMTHPSTMRRLRDVAAFAGVSDARLGELLRESLEPVPESDRYVIGEAAGEGLVFSTPAKAMRQVRLLWTAQAICTIVPALAALLALRLSLSGPLLWLALLAGPAAAFAALLLLGEYLNARWYRHLKERLGERLAAKGWGDLVKTGEFVLFAPSLRPCFFGGSHYNWDIGVAKIYGDRLCYVGEQTAFALPRDMVSDVQIRSDLPLWRRIPRAYITWRAPARFTPAGSDPAPIVDHGCAFCAAGDGRLGGTARATRQLGSRLASWLKEAPGLSSDYPPNVAALEPPRIGKVSAALPEKAVTPKVIQKALLNRAVIALVVALLCGLPFTFTLVSGWYVIAAACLLVFVQLWPLWRYKPPRRFVPQPGTPAWQAAAAAQPQAASSPAEEQT